MKINDDVLAVLSAAVVTGSSLALQGTLDRKMYVRVNEVLETCGWQWNRKAKAHICEGDAVDELDRILLTGEMEKKTAKTMQQVYGFFETPDEIVLQLVDLADVEQHHVVLEPSAGRGAIAKRLLGSVHCVEILPENHAALSGYASAKLGDFLAVPAERTYDRVVMNPPFARQADIKHVMHAAKFLKPGGRLVSVMSAGVVFREDRLAREFREFVAANRGTIEKLPEGSFKDSGTMVNTVVVTLEAA